MSIGQRKRLAGKLLDKAAGFGQFLFPVCWIVSRVSSLMKLRNWMARFWSYRRRSPGRGDQRRRIGKQLPEYCMVTVGPVEECN
jgi:hypothetical protein